MEKSVNRYLKAIESEKPFSFFPRFLRSKKTPGRFEKVKKVMH